MPIRVSEPIGEVTEQTYRQVDRLVTGVAFDIHNRYGRYHRMGLHDLIIL